MHFGLCVCVHGCVPIHLSEVVLLPGKCTPDISLNFSHMCVFMMQVCVFVLACFVCLSSPTAKQGALPEAAVIYFEIL